MIFQAATAATSAANATIIAGAHNRGDSPVWLVVGVGLFVLAVLVFVVWIVDDMRRTRRKAEAEHEAWLRAREVDGPLLRERLARLTEGKLPPKVEAPRMVANVAPTYDPMQDQLNPLSPLSVFHSTPAPVHHCDPSPSIDSTPACDPSPTTDTSGSW